MSRTVELPDELANALSDEASRAGMSLPDYAVRLLASARPTGTAVGSGADLVAFWNAEGLVGSRLDLTDAPAVARQLREQAQLGPR